MAQGIKKIPELTKITRKMCANVDVTCMICGVTGNPRWQTFWKYSDFESCDNCIDEVKRIVTIRDKRNNLNRKSLSEIE